MAPADATDAQVHLPGSISRTSRKRPVRRVRSGIPSFRLVSSSELAHCADEKAPAVNGWCAKATTIDATQGRLHLIWVPPRRKALGRAQVRPVVNVAAHIAQPHLPLPYRPWLRVIQLFARENDDVARKTTHIDASVDHSCHPAQGCVRTETLAHI